jgi:hypothetical protein
MKTIKKKKLIRRVFDDVAKIMVKEQGWEYCPNSVWKEKVREDLKVPKKRTNEKSAKAKSKKK